MPGVIIPVVVLVLVSVIYGWYRCSWDCSATPQIAPCKRPTLRSPALGRLRPLSLRCFSADVVPRTASVLDYGTEVRSPGDPVGPELASFRGIKAAFHWFSVSQFSMLAVCRPFSSRTSSNAAVPPSPMLRVTLCGLVRVIAVWLTKIPSEVSLRCMSPYPFLTLDHITVPTTR